jgi:hypothetical protein
MRRVATDDITLDVILEEREFFAVIALVAGIAPGVL